MTVASPEFWVQETNTNIAVTGVEEERQKENEEGGDHS